jgi:hypothetical protein
VQGLTEISENVEEQKEIVFNNVEEEKKGQPQMLEE